MLTYADLAAEDRSARKLLTMLASPAIRPQGTCFRGTEQQPPSPCSTATIRSLGWHTWSRRYGENASVQRHHRSELLPDCHRQAASSSSPRVTMSGRRSSTISAPEHPSDCGHADESSYSKTNPRRARQLAAPVPQHSTANP